MRECSAVDMRMIVSILAHDGLNTDRQLLIVSHKTQEYVDNASCDKTQGFSLIK